MIVTSTMTTFCVGRAGTTFSPRLLAPLRYYYGSARCLPRHENRPLAGLRIHLRLYQGATRTCDLLRVKPAPNFFWLHGIPSVLWLFDNMGSLLVTKDRVLIRF